MKYIKKYLKLSVTLLLILIPVFVSAQLQKRKGIVPCDGPDCDFNALLQLGRNVIDFLVLYISIPLATIAFTYAGFLYVTASGSVEKVKQAHAIFWKVLIGFIVILSAWLVVSTILNALLKPGYSYLEQV